MICYKVFGLMSFDSIGNNLLKDAFLQRVTKMTFYKLNCQQLVPLYINVMSGNIFGASNKL